MLQLFQGNAPIVDAQPMATAPLRASIIEVAAEIGAFALDPLALTRAHAPALWPAPAPNATGANARHDC